MASVLIPSRKRAAGQSAAFAFSRPEPSRNRALKFRLGYYARPERRDEPFRARAFAAPAPFAALRAGFQRTEPISTPRSSLSLRSQVPVVGSRALKGRLGHYARPKGLDEPFRARAFAEPALPCEGSSCLGPPWWPS